MSPDSAGVADKRSALQQIATIFLRRSFFTVRPHPKTHCRESKRPCTASYAGNDARIDSTIPDTVAAMKNAGKTYDPVTYEGAGHGFMRAGETPDGYQPGQQESPRRRLEAVEKPPRAIISSEFRLQ